MIRSKSLRHWQKVVPSTKNSEPDLRTICSEDLVLTEEHAEQADDGDGDDAGDGDHNHHERGKFWNKVNQKGHRHLSQKMHNVEFDINVPLVK